MNEDSIVSAASWQHIGHKAIQANAANIPDGQKFDVHQPVVNVEHLPVARSQAMSCPSALPRTSSGHTAVSAVATLSPGAGLLLGRRGRVSVTLRPLDMQQVCTDV